MAPGLIKQRRRASLRDETAVSRPPPRSSRVSRRYSGERSIQSSGKSVESMSERWCSETDCSESVTSSPLSLSSSMHSTSQFTSNEVDFYSNPTVLSKLILNQKYMGALNRLQHRPMEAQIWLSTKKMNTQAESSPAVVPRRLSMEAGGQPPRPSPRRNSVHAATNAGDTVYTFRQLPIHIACLNLHRTTEPSQRAILNELLVSLVVVNPEGASQPDHRGRYPLHDALWFGASAEVVTAFLSANPASILSRDPKGRTLNELNKHRAGDNKKYVQQVLDMGQAYWLYAHHEASTQAKCSAPSQPRRRSSYDTCATTGTASSMLSCVDRESDSLTSEGKSEFIEQLEQRAVAAESSLAEAQKALQDLNKQYEAIKRERKDLNDKLKDLEELTARDHASVHSSPSVMLDKKLCSMEEMVRHAIVEDEQSDDASSLGDLSSIGGPPGELVVAEDNAEIDNDDLAKELGGELVEKYDALYEKHNKQKEAIRRLKALLGPQGEVVEIADDSNEKKVDANGVPTLVRSYHMRRMSWCQGDEKSGEIVRKAPVRRNSVAANADAIVDWTPAMMRQRMEV